MVVEFRLLSSNKNVINLAKKIQFLLLIVRFGVKHMENLRSPFEKSIIFLPTPEESKLDSS